MEVIVGEGGRDVVRAFAFDPDGNGGWMQVGPDLAQSTLVQLTSMSADGTVAAIGGSYWDELPLALPCLSCSPNLGRVRVYRLTDEGGEPMGDILHGDDCDDRFGASVSLSADGLMLAEGATGSDTYGFNGRMVRIYRYDEDDDVWAAVGSDLKPAGGGERLGSAIALSGDGRRVRPTTGTAETMQGVSVSST